MYYTLDKKIKYKRRGIYTFGTCLKHYNSIESFYECLM